VGRLGLVGSRVTDVSSLKRLRVRLLRERCMHGLHLSLGLPLLALSSLPASAEKMRWEGTLELDLGSFAPVIFTGSGVATISSSGGGTRLEDLRIAGGIKGVGTIPLTDPHISATNRSIRISIEAAPWTVYSTTLVVNTVQGGTIHWIQSGRRFRAAGRARRP
jgi:hypothetical protein